MVIWLHCFYSSSKAEIPWWKHIVEESFSLRGGQERERERERLGQKIKTYPLKTPHPHPSDLLAPTSNSPLGCELWTIKNFFEGLST
jgi:hypothetical protein